MSLLAPELTYDVLDFRAGYLDSPEPSAVPKGGMPSGANCDFSSIAPDGGCKISKRKGSRMVTPAALSAIGTRVDALFEFHQEGDSVGELLAVSDGDLFAWDGDALFPLIDTIGAGALVEFMTFRNIVLICDGTVQKAYDGSDVIDVGFAAPTAAPALATHAPAGGGLTGTYQSVATWYDSTHDHESSPTAAGTAVAFVAQDRQHTKPTGSPPSNVDKWRVYVRRTDTNETQFKLVGEVAVGTATLQEAVIDSTRNLATNVIAPLPNANDVPPTFALMATALGYRFGVELDDSFVWVSALGDPQSQHPKDKIGVSRGDGQPVTTCKVIGTTIVVQKARKSFYLEGDRMPFLPKDFNGSFGNVAQGASCEAADKYWGWDGERGPYSTDFSSWTSLVDGRIRQVFSSVNKTAAVKCVHVKRKQTVCWFVATGTSTRLRTCLAYNYLVNAWLPPIYGLEFAAACTFLEPNGEIELFLGDEWGRVFQLFRDDVEGVPDGDLASAVTAATTDTVTAGGAAFYTDGDGLAGLPVAVVDENGNWQFRTIQSNTATVIALDTTHGSAWTTVPDTTYTVVVGPINWFTDTPLVTFDAPLRRKKAGYVYAEVYASGATAAALRIQARIDDTQSPLIPAASFTLDSSGLWGSGLWGTMIWGGGNKATKRKRFPRSFYSLQLQLSNNYPNQPVEVSMFGFSADGLRGQWAPRG